MSNEKVNKTSLVNQDLEVEEKFNYLKGASVGVVGGGGIAAIELPKIARELRRYGANVQFYVTENCLRFIGKEALEWASVNTVIVTPTGFADHICKDDIVLVLPGTADLIGKVANGICSDGATTYLQSAIGQKKLILFCQTMHKSLSDSDFVQENALKLQQKENIIFIPPREEEGKLKAPDAQMLAQVTSHYLNRKKMNLKNSTVLVTLGGSRVMIDAVRCLTNISTGRLGTELTYSLYCNGFSVDVFAAHSEEKLKKLPNLSVVSEPVFNDLYIQLKNLKTKKYIGFFHTAALSDFLYDADVKKKISSQKQNLSLSLTPAPKMIDLKNLKEIPFKFACKLTQTTETEGLKIAKEFMAKHSLNGILWNNASTSFQEQSSSHEAVLLFKEGAQVSKSETKGKKAIANMISNSFKNAMIGRGS